MVGSIYLLEALGGGSVAQIGSSINQNMMEEIGRPANNLIDEKCGLALDTEKNKNSVTPGKCSPYDSW